MNARQLSLQEAVAATEQVLKQMDAWLQEKLKEPQDHGAKTRTAKESVFHTRLILGVYWREQLVRAHAQAKEQARERAAARGFPPALRDIPSAELPLALVIQAGAPAAGGPAPGKSGQRPS